MVFFSPAVVFSGLIEIAVWPSLAGVPEVVPHSLRGLHATLALEGGALTSTPFR